MDEIFKNSILIEDIENFKKRGYAILGYEKKMKVLYKYYEDLINNKLFNIYNKNEKMLIRSRPSNEETRRIRKSHWNSKKIYIGFQSRKINYL